MTQPTHKEVIAWIDEQIETRKRIYNGIVGTTPESLREYHDAGIASLLANRDVLERHKVDEENYILRYEGNDNQVRYEMCMCEEDFPCPTYTDIYNRISEVM